MLEEHATMWDGSLDSDYRTSHRHPTGKSAYKASTVPDGSTPAPVGNGRDHADVEEGDHRTRHERVGKPNRLGPEEGRTAEVLCGLSSS